MNIKNLALGYVATAPSPATTGTTLTLETGEGARFPATTTASFYATLMPADANPHSENAEVVEVTDRTGDVLTIVRGQRGSTGKTVAVGWIVLNSVYKEDLTDFATITGTETLTNKTLTSPVLNTGVSGTAVLDEDDMSSNSATKLATQQSIKAYVNSNASIDSSATPSPTGDKFRNSLYITALAEDAEFAAPSGTPANGNMLLIRVLDDGTARALTYNAIYDGFADDLPSTTTISKTLFMLFMYNSASEKWEMLSTKEEG